MNIGGEINDRVLKRKKCKVMKPGTVLLKKKITIDKLKETFRKNKNKENPNKLGQIWKGKNYGEYFRSAKGLKRLLETALYYLFGELEEIDFLKLYTSQDWVKKK